MNIFERWEIDIVRLLLIIKEENRYIVVAMDYFSRWLEIRSLKVANADTVIIFLYKKIICRFVKKWTNRISLSNQYFLLIE